MGAGEEVNLCWLLLSTEETSKPCIFILGQSKPNQWPPVFESTPALCLYESSKVWTMTCPRPEVSICH